MAVTYEPISTTTLSSANNSVTFSSIPNSYTDLRLVCFAVSASSASTPSLQINGTTTSLYSQTILRGNGTAASSTNTTQASGVTEFQLPGNSGELGTTYPGFYFIDLFSYAGSTKKTILISASDDKNGSGRVARSVGLYDSTSSITSLKVFLFGGSATFSIGSTFTLYGIKAA